MGSKNKNDQARPLRRILSKAPGRHQGNPEADFSTEHGGLDRTLQGWAVPGFTRLRRKPRAEPKIYPFVHLSIYSLFRIGREPFKWVNEQMSI